MKQKRSFGQFVRATLVGGVIFLVPVLVIAVLLRHGIKLAAKLAQPLLTHMPELIGGVVVADLVAATLLLLVADSLCRVLPLASELRLGIALNGLNFNISRLIGPAIGGVLVAWKGEGACFAVASMTYLVMMAALFMVRLPASVPFLFTSLKVAVAIALTLDVATQRWSAANVRAISSTR